MHIRFKNPVQKFITWLAIWCVIAGMTAYAGPGESNPNNFKGIDTQRIHEAGIAAQTRSAKMASGASAMAMMPENPITNKPGTDGIS